MDLEKLNEELKNKDLAKESILRLINLKIESDMKEVINAIGALKNELNTFDHKLESSIGALKESILSNRSEMSTSIGSLKSENSNLKWFILAAISIATLIIKFIN